MSSILESAERFTCKCDLSDDNSRYLCKEKAFCILDNYLLFCRIRNLPDYSELVDNLRLFYGDIFKISIVKRHEDVRLQKSDDLRLCLNSTNAKTALCQALDQVCADEFARFLKAHCRNQFTYSLDEDVKNLLEHLAPKRTDF